MSTTLESLQIPKGWSKAYITQLAQYVRQRDEEGYYFGNRELFEKRHRAILNWIEAYEAYCHDNDIRFKPKDKK